jgi:hypothetical protein
MAESHLSLVRSAEPGDPIFDAIERHRRAHAIWSSAVHRKFKLEGKDDARFIESQLVTEEKAIERHNACVDLVTIYPTTIAGVIALLRYYAEHASLDGDICWPEYLDDEGEHEHGEALVRHAVTALERISEAHLCGYENAGPVVRHRPRSLEIKRGPRSGLGG